MNELIEKEDVKIENMIYEIRGKQVMLDSDLAILYKCVNGTKTINQAVKRHINRFPNDFYFQLTEEEYKDILKSQLGTLELKQGQYSKYLPYVFTEQGVAMLATVLRTEIAAEISVKIMRAFVSLRHYLMDNKDIYKSLNNLNNKIIEHDSKLDYIFSKFSLNGKLLTDNNSLYINSIFMDAKEELIIIDPYLDDNIYSLIKDIKSNIVLITSNKKKLTINRKNIKIIYNNSFHDRYIIIDRMNIYLVGTSFNSIGNKISTIIRITDNFMKNDLIEFVNNLLNS